MTVVDEVGEEGAGRHLTLRHRGDTGEVRPLQIGDVVVMGVEAPGCPDEGVALEGEGLGEPRGVSGVLPSDGFGVDEMTDGIGSDGRAGARSRRP
ncbi:hypothetical protein BH23ACT5_BH23ACT5_12390 [soil metagenome]